MKFRINNNNDCCTIQHLLHAYYVPVTILGILTHLIYNNPNILFMIPSTNSNILHLKQPRHSVFGFVFLSELPRDTCLYSHGTHDLVKGTGKKV